MCLAREEAYRQQMPPALRAGTQPVIVLMDQLPLGPLEHIKLLHHKQLDRYLHGEMMDNKCGICDEPVCLKGPVFTMCECTEMYCRGCVLNTLASVNCQKLEDSHSYCRQICRNVKKEWSPASSVRRVDQSRIQCSEWRMLVLKKIGCFRASFRNCRVGVLKRRSRTRTVCTSIASESAVDSSYRNPGCMESTSHCFLRLPRPSCSRTSKIPG